MTIMKRSRLFLDILLRAVLVFLVLVLAAWLYSSTYNRKYDNKFIHDNPTQKTYQVVAFGDSLVEGLGSPELGGFVSILEDRLEIEILNAGTRRDRTVDLLQRVHDDVLAWNPSVVILVIGGNDILRGVAQETFLENLDSLFELFAEYDITVVYGEPDFSKYIFEDYAEQVKLVASKYENVIYIEGLLQGFFFDPRKKSDLLHPNDDGYQIIANRLQLPVCRAIGKCI